MAFSAALLGTVTSFAEPLAFAKGLKLGKTMAPGIPAGRGDKKMLTRAVLNLVGNAIKFTDSGEVDISITQERGYFLGSVRDTGPGIPEEHRTGIFEPYHQVDKLKSREKGGTGLGLSIAEKLIELHGGKIWVESRLGHGSTFLFMLPVNAAEGKGSV